MFRKYHVMARNMRTGEKRSLHGPTVPLSRSDAKAVAKSLNEATAWNLEVCPAAKGWAGDDHFYTVERI